MSTQAKHTFVVAMAAALAACLAWPSSASAAIPVRTSAEFQAAVEQLKTSGGMIRLRRNTYGQLVVPARGDRRLRIVAEPGANARNLVLRNTRAVTVVGLRIAPSHGRHARVSVVGSRGIRFERLAVGGRRSLRANGSVVRSTNVVFAESTFTRCGEGKTPLAGYCVLLRDNERVRVVSSRFHDCFGCDFVHGIYNADVAIRRNSFDRAIPGRCGTDYFRCHHQDSIHLANGRDLVIDSNRFGLQFSGAAQVYVNGAIRRVKVSNNVFLGTDPRVPQLAGPTGLWIGNRIAEDVPRGVVVTNNTILTGAPRTLRGDRFPTESSVLLSPLYSGLPVAERPLFANNVIGLAKTPHYFCEHVRASVRNAIVAGKPCSQSDVAGDPQLDAQGRPSAGSTLVINRGQARYATRHDIAGVRRDALPDIGAYEYVP